METLSYEKFFQRPMLSLSAVCALTSGEPIPLDVAVELMRLGINVEELAEEMRQ